MLRTAELESSSERGNLRVLVDHTEHKLAVKGNGVLGCSRIVTSRSGEVILAPHSALMRTRLECCVWGSVPQYKRDVDILERIL